MTYTLQDFDTARDAELVKELIELGNNYIEEINYWSDEYDQTNDYRLYVVRFIQLKSHHNNTCIMMYRSYPDFFLYLSFFFLIMTLAASILYYSL